MSKPSTQRGYVYLNREGTSWNCRYYVHENGVRKQRSRKLCPKNDLYPSEKAPSVVALAESFMLKINAANAVNDAQPGHNCPLCGYRCSRTVQGRFAPKVIATQGEK